METLNMSQFAPQLLVVSGVLVWYNHNAFFAAVDEKSEE
jgi:hypothetical protein